MGTALLLNGFRPLKLLKPFMRTPEQGARTVVWLASSLEAGRVTGEYFKDERPARSSDLSRDVPAAGQLWEIRVGMSGLA